MNVDAVEAVVKKHIKGMVVVFGENKDYNELITDQMIPPRGGGPYLLDEINQELESYLKIKQVHYLPTERWAPYLTPKMSIKRKALVLNSL